ncbi:MAG: hypothetical protein AAGN35_11550 [Bacteroidota bacterium]
MIHFSMRFCGLLICFATVFGFVAAQRVGVGTLNPQARLHVAGSFRADTLAGADSRVVRTNLTGDVDGIPSGGIGEVLMQTPGGPEWEPLVFSSGGAPGGGINGCDSCAAIWSNTSSGTMSWGQCARYCESLLESGYDDWRMPTFDESMRLFGATSSANSFIWTLTPVTAEWNSTSTGR